MIVRIVKLTFDPLKTGEFLEYFEQVKRDIRTFPGCSKLELLEETTGNGVFFTYSYWNSESDLGKYLNSQMFKTTWSRVKPLFSAPAAAWSLRKLQEINC
jgi:autoinducer 2-degrading protein